MRSWQKQVQYKDQVQSESYKNFINSIDSNMTKISYNQSLIYFMQFVKAEAHDDLLKLQPQQIESKIRDWIIYLRTGT